MIRNVALAVVFSATCGLTQAQFDPAKVVTEPEFIASHFPDPTVFLKSPAFTPGRTDFTRHAEVFGFLEALARRSERLVIETVGHSQHGRAMALAVLTGSRGFDSTLPTVLILAQQHGNEPAGGEAALVITQRLLDERNDLLERANVLIMPRANPDAAELFARESVNGIDVNRDHLLIRTPEARAISAAVQRYSPQVVLDLHEFTVAGRWVTKFGAFMRADALLQAATVGNLSPRIQQAQERYLLAARGALQASGQSVDVYHTSSNDPKDMSVAMGGVNADTGRNVAGLRNSISLLLETRGVGIGRAHFARRVQAHALATLAVIEAAANDGPALVQLQRNSGLETAQQACSGTLSVVVRQTEQRRTLNFLDAQSGKAREIEVAWKASDRLQVERERSRPCGYLLGADQQGAVQRLRALGVEVLKVDVVLPAHPWEVEDYLVETQTTGRRQDARGAIADDPKGILVLQVKTQSARIVPTRGAYYVPLNQALAALASAALEPDSQNSFAANRLLSIEAGQLRRVMQQPPAGSTTKPVN